MMSVDHENFSCNYPSSSTAFNHVQSPRVQGCVSSLLQQLFDWHHHPGKRIPSASSNRMSTPGHGSLPGMQADSISPRRRRSRLSSSGGSGHHQGFIKDQCTDSNCIRRPARKFLLQQNGEENHSCYGVTRPRNKMLLSRKQHLFSRSLTFSDDRNKLQEEAPHPPPPPGVVARLMGLESLRAAGKTPTDLMHPPQHRPCADLLDDENHLSTTQSSVTEKWQQPATRWKLDLDNLEEEEHQDAPFGPKDDHDHGSKLLVQQGNLGIFHEHSLIAEKSQPSSPFLLSSRSHLLSSPKILGSPEASILEFKTNLGNQTNTSDSTHHRLFTKIELPSQRSHDPYEAQNSLQSTQRKKVAEKQKFSDRQQQINKVFSGVSNLQNDESKKMTALEQQQMEKEQQESPVKQVNTRWEEAQPQCKFESKFDGWSLRFVKDLQTPATVVNRRPSLQPIGGPYGMIQQFKSRAMFKEENKETTGDQEKCMPTHSNTYVQSHQLPNPGNAALDAKVICGGVPNSEKLHSNKKHRIKREWSDEEGDSCLESQSLDVRRSILWHSCRSFEAAAAAASAATLDKHSRFQPSGRKNQIKIRRPDGTVKMMKTTCCDLELLVPGDNIAGNLTGDDAVRESELTAASVPRESLLSNSQTHLLTNPQFNAGKKTSLFHATTERSVNKVVFPELPWDETHLKRRSKEDDSMIRSENSTSTTPGMMCNDWIPKTFSEDFPVPGGSTKSSLQNLQRHDHDKKDLSLSSSSSSSSSIQQGHSSLCQFFVSETEVTSLNRIWGSKLLSLPENDDNIVQLDFSTNSSSIAFHGCSSPDHNNNQENLKITLDVGWSEDPMKTTPIFVKKILDNTEVPSLTQLDKEDVDAKLQHALMEECGHPSPVSILESPFLDESPTTSEESISESEQSLDGIVEDGYNTASSEPSLLLDKEALQGVAETAGTSGGGRPFLVVVSESNQVRHALLDISSFWSNNTMMPASNSLVDSEQEEMSYIQEVLDASKFLSNPMQTCFCPGVCLFNPFLFEQLELQRSTTISLQDKDMDDDDDDNATELLQQSSTSSSREENFVKKNPSCQGSLWQRGDRRLLFDSVSEIILDVFCDLQFAYRDDVVSAARKKLQLDSKSGGKLVTEVYGKICEWRNFATNALQSLVDRDMRVHGCRWFELSREVEELGVDIEHTIFEVMFDELISDLFQDSKTIHKFYL
ncbi:unnamed protein product [Sphagnum compactum]